MVPTRNLAIMFTDIKGYTAKTSGSSRSEIVALIKEHEQVILPIAERFGGTLVKTIGDAFLIVYDSPTNAVLAGMAMQETLTEHNEGKSSDNQLTVRVAINSGEVTLIDGDVYGEAVNIAARIEGIAEGGDVFFTESVYLSMTKAEVPSAEIGYKRLKGIPEPIRVYKVLKDHHETHDESSTNDTTVAPPPSTSHDKEPTRQRGGFWRRLVALMIDVFVFSLLTTSLIASFYTQPELLVMTLTPKGGDNVQRADSEQVFAENIIVKEGKWHIQGHSGSSGTSIQFNDGYVIIESPGEEPIRMANPDINITLSPIFTPKALLWILYCTLFLSLFGATPGKLALSLKVIDPELSSPRVPVIKALLRSVFFLVSFMPMGLGCLWAFTNKQRRTWHDSVSKTLVVMNRKD